jgi:hypothetical protein
MAVLIWMEYIFSFTMHIFDAEIKARIYDDSLKGYYKKNIDYLYYLYRIEIYIPWFFLATCCFLWLFIGTLHV